MEKTRGITGNWSLCVLAASLLALASCCSVPQEGFMALPETQQKVQVLKDDFIKLLPENQQQNQEAKKEAGWLAETAYEQSAEIARRNRPVFIGWINNTLVNGKLLDRGLCWQYQHDLFRELRRKPLHFFKLGATTRDRATGREHNCVYVTAKDKGFMDSIVLDPWAKCGNLKLLYPEDRKPNWQDAPDWERELKLYFPEGHTYSDRTHIETYEDEEDGKNYARLREE